MMSRLEAEIRALAAQVATLTTVATETRAELKAHAELQATRTVGRDKEMTAVREQLRDHEQSIAEAERWRWMMVGRIAGVMAAAGAGGAGLMSAAAKLLG